MRLTPNTITLLGLPFGGLAAFFLYEGAFLPAILFILLLSGCDILDGYIAKTKQLATPFGAFLDSTVDRVTELLLFAGILFFYLAQGDMQTAAVAYGVMGGSFLVSYTRARAENLIPNCRVGLWERPERLGLLLIGLVSGYLQTALWILLFGTTLTIFHRIFYTRRVLSDPNFRSFQNGLFRDYPRNSWSYRLYVLVVILLTLLLK